MGLSGGVAVPATAGRRRGLDAAVDDIAALTGLPGHLVTVRQAVASMARVVCRYQGWYWRAW